MEGELSAQEGKREKERNGSDIFWRIKRRESRDSTFRL